LKRRRDYLLGRRRGKKRYSGPKKYNLPIRSGADIEHLLLQEDAEDEYIKK
jgi:hypothetical protein